MTMKNPVHPGEILREDVLADLEKRAETTGDDWARAATARCRGLLEADGALDADFVVALELDGPSSHVLATEEAASRLGISRVAFSRVLHGHARISPNLAVRLEEAGVGTARAWLAMQSAHDLAAERATGVPKVRRLDHVA